MEDIAYRIDWSRPVAPSLPGERAYHATDGVRHILVVLTNDQILAAERLAEVMRTQEPDVSLQQVIEEAVVRAVEAGRLIGGKLRPRDEDFE